MFQFLDPFASFLQKRTAIYSESGDLLFDSTGTDWDDASVRDLDFGGILELGLAASKHLQGVTSKQRWTELVTGYQQSMSEKRQMLTQLSATAKGISYVDETGAPLPADYAPDWTEQSDPEVINAIVSLLRSSNEQAISGQTAEFFAQQYAIAALKALDTAVSGIRFEGGAGTVASVIIATKCLANAVTLVERGGTLQTFAQRLGLSGAKGRDRNFSPAREWVRSQWQQEHAAYKGKADFARIYVPLVLQRFGIQVTEDTIRESWLPKKNNG